MKQFARQCVAIVRTSLMGAARATLQRPIVRRGAASVLDLLPWLRAALRRAGRRAARARHVPHTAHDLSPETLAAYRALQKAFAKQRH